MATHSSILAWKIPWTEEPGRVQSMGLQRVGHNWVTSLTFFILSLVKDNQFYWSFQRTNFCFIDFLYFLFSIVLIPSLIFIISFLLLTLNLLCFFFYSPKVEGLILWWLSGKEPACQYRRCRVWSLGWEDPLEKEMATYSSIPAWEIPWTEKPDGLQSMWLQRIGHDLATKQQQGGSLDDGF